MMIKSPLDLKDLDITDLIIHRIFLPGQQAHFDVEPSKNVIPLTGKAKITLQQRLTKVLSKGSKCIEMDVDDTDSLEKIHTLQDSGQEVFISKTQDIAVKLAGAQTSKQHPEGVLVVARCSYGLVKKKRAIAIIKAELHEGFTSTVRDNVATIDYLNNLILTPEQKLYKVAFFSENIRLPKMDKNSYEVFLFDNNLTSKDDLGAAVYFYKSFLGLKIASNSSRLTRSFYEITDEYINEKSDSLEEKIDLAGALRIYLKTEQSEIIGTSDFSKKYIPIEKRDDYVSYCQDKNTTISSFKKDNALIKNRIKSSTLKFSNEVKIIYPAVDGDSPYKIIERNDDFTVIKINGRLIRD
ncbi:MULTISPECIES: nucleoid-associated protein [Enterobacterales]|uniref:nucleoid-associated protein n=1 Tax=Enterobacterales TaxID=91347 RepID=UPI001E529A43|nr:MULTISPECIES: nucleoid-associated protein [Enterobacterales]WAB88637.1 nucleoid-associated protein [Pantoea agglomerans]